MARDAEKELRVAVEETQAKLEKLVQVNFALVNEDPSREEREILPLLAIETLHQADAEDDSILSELHGNSKPYAYRALRKPVKPEPFVPTLEQVVDASGKTFSVQSGLQTDLNYLVRDFTFSGDGRYLAAREAEDVVYLHDFAAKRGTLLQGGSLLPVSFGRDGRYFITTPEPGDDGRYMVKVWDTRGGKPVAINLAGNMPSAVALSADGRRVATGDQKGVTAVWEVDPAAGTARTLRLLTPKPDPASASSEDGGGLGSVTALAFGPDGSRLLTANSNG